MRPAFEVFESTGLELGKWSSNDINLISNLSGSINEYKIISMQEVDTLVTKVLGLIWNFGADTLQFKVRDINSSSMTMILAEISCLFSPKGVGRSGYCAR